LLPSTESSAVRRAIWGGGGVTDELRRNFVEDPVPISDFHATNCYTFRNDPANELKDGGRPVLIADRGKAIRILLA
jgi:hypothetical protein